MKPRLPSILGSARLHGRSSHTAPGSSGTSQLPCIFPSLGWPSRSCSIPYQKQLGFVDTGTGGTPSSQEPQGPGATPSSGSPGFKSMSRVNGGARAKPEERREESGFCSQDPGKGQGRDQGRQVLPRPSPAPPPPPPRGQGAQDRPRPHPSTGVLAGTKQAPQAGPDPRMNAPGEQRAGGEGTHHQLRAGTPIKSSRIRNLGTPMPTFCPCLLLLLAPPVLSAASRVEAPTLRAFPEPSAPTVLSGPSSLIGNLRGSPLLLSLHPEEEGVGGTQPLPRRMDFPRQPAPPGPTTGCTCSAPHLDPWPATGSRLPWRGDQELSRPGAQQHLGLGLQANIPRPRPTSLQAPLTCRTQCWWASRV